MSYNIYLPVPAIYQRTAETTDNRPSEAANLDCGEGALASTVAYLTGVGFLPDEIHDIIWAMTGRTPETAGPTNEYDLQFFLDQRCATPTTFYYPLDTGSTMGFIRQYLFGGRLLIALRSFAHIGDLTGHWVVINGATGPDVNHTTQVTAMDPWVGGFWTVSNKDFFGWLRPDYPNSGDRLLIGVDRTRDPFLG